MQSSGKVEILIEEEVEMDVCAKIAMDWGPAGHPDPMENSDVVNKGAKKAEIGLATLPQRAASIIPGLRRPSKLGENEQGGSKGRATKRREQRTDVVPWGQENDMDVSVSSQRQESLVSRVRRRMVGSGVDDDEGDMPWAASRSSQLRTSRIRGLSKTRRRQRGYADAKDYMGDLQLDRFGFTYGDKDLDTSGFCWKRKALSNVKAYIAEMSVPESEAGWSILLSNADRNSLRNRKMEAPHSGEYANFAKLRDIYGDQGVFRCRGCRNFLFDAAEFDIRGFPWAAFRAALPGCLDPEPSQLPQSSKAVPASTTVSIAGTGPELLCQKCKSFIGRKHGHGGIFAGSRSIEFHPMTVEEVDIIKGLCAKKLRKLCQSQDQLHRLR